MSIDNALASPHRVAVVIVRQCAYLGSTERPTWESPVRDELLQVVRARVDAAIRGDLDPALAAEARTEAEQLLEHLGTPTGPDAEVLHAVGLLHWVRWELLHERAPSEAAASAQLAVVFLTPVCLIDPHCIPTPLAEDLETPRSPGEAGKCYDLGRALTAVAFVTGETSTHTRAIELLATAALDIADSSDPRRPDYLAGGRPPGC